MKITLDTAQLLNPNKWYVRQFDMIASLLLTLIAFFYLFGFTVLNVYNTSFVVGGGDFTVSYLGSVFYRMDEWRWPLFTHQNLAFPYGISVHGTDGSPMLSLIFKVFHKFFGLPADVQFVGVWMLICYILQSVFSVLIFRKFIKNKFLIAVASLFLVSAPIMMMRVFVHINLMCHFILLWAIYLWIENKLTTKTWIAMGVLITLATLTCPYFLPMVGGFFAVLILKKLLIDKDVSWLPVLIGVVSLGGVFGCWFYLLGMLTTEQVLTSGGWRGLGLNLTALFNPTWSQSRIFTSITPKADFDADNYFGFGLIILLLMLFPQVKDLFKRENLKKNALIALLLLGFFVFALSSQVKLGTAVVLDYKPGEIINWLGSVFRYSGRFFWPIWYLLAIFLLSRCVKTFPRGAYLILPALLFVQIWDLYPTYRAKSDFVMKPYTPSEPFVSAEWDRLDKMYQNVFIFAHNDNYRDMWRWAIRHKKNVNYGFLNRPSQKTHKLVNEAREAILSGYVLRKEYFYLIDSELMKRIDDTAKLNPAVAKLKSKIKTIDGFKILEYDEELAQVTKSFNQVNIPVTHRYWSDNIVQMSEYRVFRNVNNEFTDYATILHLDDTYLMIRWDKYGEEYFKKEQDGRYHQIMEKPKIEVIITVKPVIETTTSQMNNPPVQQQPQENVQPQVQGGVDPNKSPKPKVKGIVKKNMKAIKQ